MFGKKKAKKEEPIREIDEMDEEPIRTTTTTKQRTETTQEQYAESPQTKYVPQFIQPQKLVEEPEPKKEKERELPEEVKAYTQEYAGSFSPKDFLGQPSKVQPGIFEAEVCSLLFAAFSELRKLRKMQEGEQ